jgi:citrate synthase
VPSIAAWACHSIGRSYVYPDNDLSFTGNFLNMLFKMTELRTAEPVHPRSTSRYPARRPRAELQHHDDADDRQLARRSALAMPAWRRATARTAANEAVLMLNEIGSVAKVPEFIKNEVGSRQPAMGFATASTSPTTRAPGHQAHRRHRLHRDRKNPLPRSRRARAHR